MIDFNLLPGQYRARKLSLTAMRPWLFVVTSILVFGLARYQYSITHSGLQSVGRDLEEVQAELDNYLPLIEEKGALEAQITIANAEIYEIETAYEFVAIQTIVWSDIINTVIENAPSGLDFTSVSQSMEELVLLGITEDYHLPLTFSEELEAMGLSPTVSVVSIVKVAPAETEGAEIEVDEEVSEPVAPIEIEGDESVSESVAPIETEGPPQYEFEITLNFYSEVEGP